MWNIPAAKAYGGILLTRSGKILLREPANHFDGYVWTYAKGRPGPGDSPEATALREVREETGYEAEIVDVLPGLFKGGTTTTAFFVMRHIGPQGRTDWETESVRWMDFEAAEKLIALTTNPVGRTRDLAILQAAKAWFAGNQTVVLPDDEKLPFPARKWDWRTQDLPARHVVIPLDFTLTAAEAARVRMGFIPQYQEEHWFFYFADNTLYQHRSWTGFCIDQVHFVPHGDGLRATHAEVNRDPEQYSCVDDAEDARRIEAMVRDQANREAATEPTSSLMQAIELASQPNYLGSPDTIIALLNELLQVHQAALLGEATFADKQSSHARLTRIMSEDGTGYTRMPAWHTETALGQNLIKAFKLDAEYCHGENLFFIVSEGVAALGMAVDRALKTMLAAMASQEISEGGEEPDQQLVEVLRFAVAVFLGTQTVMFPGKTLDDF